MILWLVASEAWAALAVGVSVGVAGALAVVRVLRAAPPPASGRHRPAGRAVLKRIPYPRPWCSRCGREIVMEHERDRYWHRSSPDGCFDYCRRCADERGEPLPGP